MRRGTSLLTKSPTGVVIERREDKFRRTHSPQVRYLLFPQVCRPPASVPGCIPGRSRVRSGEACLSPEGDGRALILMKTAQPPPGAGFSRAKIEFRETHKSTPMTLVP